MVDRSTQRSIDFITNADGMVLRRTESKGGSSYTHDYFYAGGRRIGDVTNDPERRVRISYVEQLAQDLKATPSDKFKHRNPVTSADWDQNYEPINATYPGASASSTAPSAIAPSASRGVTWLPTKYMPTMPMKLPIPRVEISQPAVAVCNPNIC